VKRLFLDADADTANVEASDGIEAEESKKSVPEAVPVESDAKSEIKQSRWLVSYKF